MRTITGRSNHPLQASHLQCCSAATDADRARILTRTRSLFFRNNFAMLGAVFGSAFALSMYGPN